MNAQREQQQQKPVNEQVLNTRLEEAVKIYGDLCLRKEDLDRELDETRRFIRQLHRMAPLTAEVAQAVAKCESAAPAAESVHAPPSPVTPLFKRKRGRPSKAQKEAEAAAQEKASA